MSSQYLTCEEQPQVWPYEPAIICMQLVPRLPGCPTTSNPWKSRGKSDTLCSNVIYTEHNQGVSPCIHPIP
ncbi:hypothetical protein, partial [Dictyobacter formicarum]|uniref:hypothetical protein n=1 Tax=Dictyobacter formicarum TaxID=2778368 RepID=UPI001F40300F